MARLTNFIKGIVEAKAASGASTSIKQISDALNAAGVKTKDGKLYTGGRGVGKIVRDTFNELKNNGDTKGAQTIYDHVFGKDGKTLRK